jgi:hypothetical protein
MGKITRNEWRWPAIFAALVMVLTSVPYLAAGARQTDQWRFGGFLFGVEDGNSYIANMGQGARGAWLFTLPYSSEPQPGALIYTFYLALGHLAGPSHDAQVLAFQAARLAGGWAMLLVSYRFLAEFLPRVKQRRLALALVAGGGGLGWLLVLSGHAQFLGSLPVDFISPEAFSFLDLYGLPHLAVARGLFLLGLLAHARGRPVWAGLALLALSLIQPLYVLVAWAILGVDVGLGWLLQRTGADALADVKDLIVSGLISSPLVLYTTVILSFDPVLKPWLAQNRLPSPHPIHYVLAYGVYLLLGVWGWRALTHVAAKQEVIEAQRAKRASAEPGAGRKYPRYAWRRINPATPEGVSNRLYRLRLARLVGAWVVVTPFLLYAPLSTQRRLVEGFQLPLVILAVWGLTVALRRWRYWLLPVTLSLTLPTAVLLLASGVAGTLQPAEPVYRPAAELEMFGWLSAQAASGQVALSAYDTGNVLPAYTPLTAYIGHGPETVNLAAKAPRVTAFYQAATSEADRRQLLADGRVTWVVFGPAERKLGDFDPAPAAIGYLHEEFSTGDYAVYRVIP